MGELTKALGKGIKMAVMSLLRPALGQVARSILLRGGAVACRIQQASLPITLVRQMGGHNRMQVTPSRFEWERWKNDVHFYVFLGLVPMGLLILYCNLFIGPAELADIPEGYEPLPWEYHKGPIQRFFVKHVYEPQERTYERTLHILWEETERRKMRLLEKKVKALMHDRQDYKGWYYTPMDKSRIDFAKKSQDEWKEVHGTRIP